MNTHIYTVYIPASIALEVPAHSVEQAVAMAKAVCHTPVEPMEFLIGDVTLRIWSEADEHSDLLTAGEADHTVEDHEQLLEEVKFAAFYNGNTEEINQALNIN